MDKGKGRAAPPKAGAAEGGKPRHQGKSSIGGLGFPNLVQEAAFRVLGF